MSSSRPTRVLYVEDDSDIREVARLALEALGGYEVCACASGGEALQRAAGFSPDVVLLDVMMPGMDGPETMAALRAVAATSQTPVIFMTARVEESDRAEYVALGAAGLIEKPFDPMELSDEVARLYRGAARA
jgi:two-component system OmpR family response regulator